jgi:hypothetical protein
LARAGVHAFHIATIWITGGPTRACSRLGLLTPRLTGWGILIRALLDGTFTGGSAPSLRQDQITLTALGRLGRHGMRLTPLPNAGVLSGRGRCRVRQGPSVRPEQANNYEEYPHALATMDYHLLPLFCCVAMQFTCDSRIFELATNQPLEVHRSTLLVTHSDREVSQPLLESVTVNGLLLSESVGTKQLMCPLGIISS